MSSLPSGCRKSQGELQPSPIVPLYGPRDDEEMSQLREHEKQAFCLAIVIGGLHQYLPRRPSLIVSSSKFHYWCSGPPICGVRTLPSDENRLLPGLTASIMAHYSCRGPWGCYVHPLAAPDRTALSFFDPKTVPCILFFPTPANVCDQICNLTRPSPAGPDGNHANPRIQSSLCIALVVSLDGFPHQSLLTISTCRRRSRGKTGSSAWPSMDDCIIAAYLSSGPKPARRAVTEKFSWEILQPR